MSNHVGANEPDVNLALESASIFYFLHTGPVRASDAEDKPQAPLCEEGLPASFLSDSCWFM